jgi:hypothetical protein
MRKYFFTDGLNKFGPFSKDELKHQKITRSTKVWYYGIDQWTDIKNIIELNEIINSIPPELKPINFQGDIKIDFNKVKQNEKPIKTKQKYNNIKSIKYISYAAISIIIIFIIIRLVQNKIEDNLHKVIIANSYDTGENLNIYVETFYRDLEFYGIFPRKPITSIIKFSSLDKINNTTHIHALSLGHNNDDRIEIYINPSSWKQFTKPMRYFLMYHELAHDVLNLDDLDNKSINSGKLMYPEISSYEKKSMDDFIESFHALFEEQMSKSK